MLELLEWFIELFGLIQGRTRQNINLLWLSLGNECNTIAYTRHFIQFVRMIIILNVFNLISIILVYTTIIEWQSKIKSKINYQILLP